MKKAVITGITGQDGSYLAELLLSKEYEVYGIIRRSSQNFISSDDGSSHQNGYLEAHKNLHYYYGDLSDSSGLERVIKEVKPDEIYNLGAMSDVRVSFDVPEYTGDITALGIVRILEAVRNNGLSKTKIYQASTSELYGKVVEIPQNETTPFYPRSPYAVSKLYAHWICKNYKEAYGMFIASGILFNHESPRRGPNFVTRKISRGVANILAGRQDKIYLGNLESKRDWGYAPEYVDAMWQMLQLDEPEDFVLATGESHTVKEFVEEAFEYVGLDWTKYIEVKEQLFRPSEVDLLRGDASKAKKLLKWEPKVKFKELVGILVDADIAEIKSEYAG
ncbi:MAG: GDP-mannose 4,6-dehydratase [Patescibacteria group bacterium]